MSSIIQLRNLIVGVICIFQEIFFEIPFLQLFVFLKFRWVKHGDDDDDRIGLGGRANNF